jgi:hypothetical protein
VNIRVGRAERLGPEAEGARGARGVAGVAAHRRVKATKEPVSFGFTLTPARSWRPSAPPTRSSQVRSASPVFEMVIVCSSPRRAAAWRSGSAGSRRCPAPGER